MGMGMGMGMVVVAVVSVAGCLVVVSLAFLPSFALSSSLSAFPIFLSHFGGFFCCQFFEGFVDLFFKICFFSISIFFRITGAKARRKFFFVNFLFLLILLQILVDSRFQLFIRGGSKKNLVLFGNLPTTIPHTPLQPPNPLLGTPLLKKKNRVDFAL